MTRSSLSELGEFRNGVNFGKGSKGSGLGLINVKDIFTDSPRVNFESLDFVNLADSKGIDRYFVEEGDLFFVRSSVKRDGIGYVIHSDRRNYSAVHCGFVIRFRPDKSKVDYRFLTYALRSPAAREAIRNLSGGAAITNISQESLGRVSLELPSLRNQQRIAQILSAYDDLIENCQQRIRILESMALALYREWFVHFRFPGHENHLRVASALGEIPAGWKTKNLAEICVEKNGIQTGPFGSQLHESDYADEGVPVVMPKDLIGFRIQTTTIARIPEETANKLSRHRMQLGDIVYGRRGDIGRRAFLMSHQRGWFCGTGCLRVRPDTRHVNGWYLFNYLGQDDVVGLIKGRAQGVTMPNLNTGLLSSVPVRLPPRELQDEFSRLTFPMAEAREALTATIDNLRRTRDLLLPRLLSGQLDVAAA